MGHAAAGVDLAAPQNRIDHPDPFHTEAQVLAHLVERFSRGVFRRQNLDAQIRRLSDDAAAESTVRPFGHNANVGNAESIGADLNALFGHCEQAQAAADDAQLLDQKTLNAGMFPSWHGALDDFPFHKFGIVLEAGTKVLLGAGKLGNSHEISLQ
jgi:hypothetical protein